MAVVNILSLFFVYFSIPLINAFRKFSVLEISHFPCPPNSYNLLMPSFRCSSFSRVNRKIQSILQAGVPSCLFLCKYIFCKHFFRKVYLFFEVPLYYVFVHLCSLMISACNVSWFLLFFFSNHVEPFLIV